MDEEHDYGGSGGSNLETSKAERSVWLMKCPLAVAKSWQSHPPSHPQPLAKVVLSLDPLRADDPSALQVLLSYITDLISYALYNWDFMQHPKSFYFFGVIDDRNSEKRLCDANCYDLMSLMDT